jgi:hypothetical protein
MADVLPSAEAVKADWYVTPSHQVWINNQIICATDREYLADLIVRAIEHWRHTEDGKKWWAEQQHKDSKDSKESKESKDSNA